ncbi:MAG: zinc ribbon domain-containing protein [Bacteroidales bacterium]|nr:zinc ribbon domain-containing protein [Bacteroidales bacterium]
MSLIICPECGQEVSSKAICCPHCGVAIAGNIKRCPICHSTMLMDAKECPHCHTPLEAGQQTTPEPDDDTKQASSPQPAAAHVPSSVLPKGDSHEDNENATGIDSPQLEPSEGPLGKGMPWYFLLFVIVILVIGGYLYWNNYQQRCNSEEQAYQLLRDCNDPLNYEDFIARYPDSEHLDEVRLKLKELQREDALWEVVANSGNIDNLKSYIENHPHSPYVKVALHKIDSLEWREADKLGTSDAYNTYILHHDAGEYISEAYEARDAALGREQQARRDSLAAAEALADSMAAEANNSAQAPEGIDELMQ